MSITSDEILIWLHESDPVKIEELRVMADRVRSENVGDAVHLRGLIELSNHCRRSCHYCGIRAGNTHITRYRLGRDEVLHAAADAVRFEYGSIVIQAGEDPGIDATEIANIVREIKDKTPLAITLSLGERDEADWKLWKNAGADRYLLRFETSNAELYNTIHPPLPNREPGDRLEMLRRLREIGYEIGSGVMIGIPGQTYEDLANDLEIFRELDLDMIGCGPFLPHPDTPLGQRVLAGEIPPSPEQVPATEISGLKMISLARLVRPDANIPSTTAIATLDAKEGRKKGLSSGANVIMPNLTPQFYRKLYEIYPNKAASEETAEQTHLKAMEHLKALGRQPGKGPGGRG